MTVVIGAIANAGIVFASDGCAFQQDEANNIVRKDDFYNKISAIEERFAFGCAGSHELAFLLNEKAKQLGTNLSEFELLESLRLQIRHINSINSKKKTAVIFGYINVEPKLYHFNTMGEYKRKEIVAIGAGADEAIDYLESQQLNLCGDIQDIILHLVEAIYEAARCPTVNFVPMISYLTFNGFVDLSGITVDMFVKFKNELKLTLATHSLLGAEK